MKQYERYKDSGIQWLGDIPRHWSLVPLKYNLSLKGRIGWNGLKSDEFKENSYAYLVTGQDFTKADIDWSKCYQIDKDRYDEDPFIQLANGDLLVTKDGTIGKVAKVSGLDKPACLNSGIFVIKQIKKAFIQDYLYWTFVSNQLVDFNNFNSTGSTIQHLYQNVFENMPLLVPTIDEQQAIASYLDYKVGQIDAAIKEKEAMLKDLKAYRTAIISEAVTKGNNPNARMKDSGIEWIGQIPVGWEIKRLSLFTTKIGSGKTPTGGAQVYTEDGVLFIRSQNVYNNGLVTNDIAYISEEVNRTMLNSKVVYQDVLLNITGGSIGRSCLIIDENIHANVNQHVCIIRSKKDVLDSAFLHYQIIASLIQNQIKACQTGGNREELNFEQIGKFIITIPPLPKQQELVTYLDTKTQKIDAAIISLEKQREDLNLLKQSIITEAVTGKVDLREWNSKTVTA